MVSDFITHDGYLVLCADELATHIPKTARDSGIWRQEGGYWTAEKFNANVSDAATIDSHKYP